jgi:hypothetical protein
MDAGVWAAEESAWMVNDKGNTADGQPCDTRGICKSGSTRQRSSIVVQVGNG